MLGYNWTASSTSTDSVDRLDVPADTQIAGPIRTEQPARIAGTIRGDLRTRQNTIITQGGLVRGDIRARAARIVGTVEGDICAETTLILQPSAQVRGDITADRLLLKQGAQFQGHCHIEEHPEAPPAHTR